MILCIDPGTKNIGISIFNIIDDEFHLILIDLIDKEKLKIFLKKFKFEYIIIENQYFKSKNINIVYFIEGYCYAKNMHCIKTILKNYGKTYAKRKQYSIDIIKEKDSKIYNYIKENYKKRDDVSDSFNLAYDFFIRKKLIYKNFTYN